MAKNDAPPIVIKRVKKAVMDITEALGRLHMPTS
jgi:hypothetical protein